MTQVAIYARVSSLDQAEEGFSIDAQLDRMRHYAKAQGWTVADEYIDNGISARTVKRGQYMRMMQEQDRWDVLLVLKLDRLHRNARNFLDLMAQLQATGKQFASVMESLDTGTAMGRFVMSIMSNVAQLESDQNGERTRMGMQQKAKSKSGGLGGPAPFGYKWDNGILAIVPDEAVIVRRIHAMKIDKPDVIAAQLNSEGLKTRKGRPWTFWNVTAVLNGKQYHGDLHWNGIVQREAHEAIF